MKIKTFIVILFVVAILLAIVVPLAVSRPAEKPKLLQVLAHSNYPAMRNLELPLAFSGIGIGCLNRERKGGLALIVYDGNDRTQTVYFDEGFDGTLDRIYKADEKNNKIETVYNRSIDFSRPERMELEKQYLAERQKATEMN